MATVTEHNDQPASQGPPPDASELLDRLTVRLFLLCFALLGLILLGEVVFYLFR